MRCRRERVGTALRIMLCKAAHGDRAFAHPTLAGENYFRKNASTTARVKTPIRTVTAKRELAIRAVTTRAMTMPLKVRNGDFVFTNVAPACARAACSFSASAEDLISVLLKMFPSGHIR